MHYIPAATIRNANNIPVVGTSRVAQPANNLRKILPKMTIGDGESQVFTMRYSDDDQYLACGYGDGMTRIYNTLSGKLSYTLQSLHSDDDMPVTCLAWRPTSSALKTANILVTGSADGAIRHWHATTGKCLHQKVEDPNNHIYALDFSQDGMLLATAGKDHKINIYDETTKSHAFQMHELADLPGHSNRVFCVKFNKQNPNMVVSGGWDNTLQFYDLRYRGPVRTLYGPHICGDTIDFTRDGTTMVTGSYRIDDCIEAWDLRMFRRSRVIPWEGLGSQEVLMYDEDESDPQTDLEEAKSNRTESALSRADSTTTATKKVRKSLRQEKTDAVPYLYTTMFNKRQDLLFAGGAGRNEMRVFDWETGQIVGMISNLPAAVMSGACANNSDLFSFGAADSKVRIFSVES